MIEIIFQDIHSGRISKVESCEKEEKEKILSRYSYKKDCDEDSFLIQSSLPPDPELARIMKSSDVKFGDSLLPVLALDKEGVVLMQAFVNEKALQLSFETNFAHYYSRSRNKLWKKGEESGHVQEIFTIEYSPLYHYLVYRVSQNVCACHTGYYSCFYREIIDKKEIYVYPSVVQI